MALSVRRRLLALLSSLTLIASLALVGTTLTPRSAIAAQRVSCSSPAASFTVCRIDEPNVRQRVTPYPAIRFRPGDRVLVEAGGCVQHGGNGKTWKRYVNPIGPASDHLYHGLIQGPGATSGLVRISSVVGVTLTVPAGGNPNDRFLRLGYEDNHYDDNGYWSPDPGWGDQCTNSAHDHAWVLLKITHRGSGPTSSPTLRAPLDLVPNGVDDNRLWLNPQWALQVSQPGALPDVEKLCDRFPYLNSLKPSLGVSFGNPRCTTQEPAIDFPTDWNAFWCKTAGESGTVRGHVNWGPATYTGTIAWESHSAPGADDDYNMRLVPPNQAGLLPGNGGSLLLEFDSDETIDHFHSPWWSRFHQAVDGHGGNPHAMVDGSPAIAVGLVGVDNVHTPSTEIHPVWALAMDVDRENPSDDTWAIFVRNWGDEGYCSRLQHYLDAQSITFRIPWWPGATGVSEAPSTTFLRNYQQAAGPDIAVIPGQAVLVTFHLPGPEAHGRLNGELHLRWAGAPALRAVVAAAVATPAAAASSEHGDAERRVEAAAAGMSPAQRATYEARLRQIPNPESGIEATPLPVVGTPSVLAVAAALPGLPSPRVRAVEDPQREILDRQRIEALCAAYGGTVPNAPPGFSCPGTVPGPIGTAIAPAVTPTPPG